MIKIFPCHYCQNLFEDNHTCPQCNVIHGGGFTASGRYTNYTMYINETFYCLQFRHYNTQDKVVLRIGDNQLIKLNNDFKLKPEEFRSFLESNKVKTYKVFS